MRGKTSYFDIAVTEPMSSTPTAASPVKKRMRPLAAGARFAPHSHRWAQLTLCTTGMLHATVFGATSKVHLVLPSHGLWIPAGVTHLVEARTGCVYVSLYIEMPHLPGNWVHPRIVSISPFLRELIEQLDVKRTLADASRNRAITDLLLEEIRSSSSEPQGIPLPSDRRLAALCREVLGEANARQATSQMAARHGLSTRTLLRLSRQELNMSFAEWRRVVMVARAVKALQSGALVTEVAAESGYRSVSAFNKAFRSVMGTSPRRVAKDELL